MEGHEHIHVAIGDDLFGGDGGVLSEEAGALEAFLFASRKTTEFYKAENRLATEHALIEDNGDGLGTPDRIGALYEITYSRPATQAEVSRGTAYLERLRTTLGQSGVASSEVEAKAWTSLCRAVLAANEFVYVE